MKRNLRDIAKKANGGQAPSPEQMEHFSNVAKQYEGRSESDLIGELVSNYRSGVLSDAELERFVKQAGPMLSPAQRQKLSSVLRQIRG